LTEGCCLGAGGEARPVVDERGEEPSVVLFPAAEVDVELLGEKPGGAPDVDGRQEGSAGGPAEAAGPISGTPGEQGPLVGLLVVPAEKKGDSSNGTETVLGMSSKKSKSALVGAEGSS
jgi:hypothetical protein